MKNVKKILAFVLATIMALSCLAGMMPVFAAEDDAAEVPTPTYSLNFTKYYESMQEAFYFNSGAGSFYIDETGSNGYLTVGLNGATGAAYFKIGNGTFQKGSDVVVDVPANQMGYFVIKYKTTQSHVAALRVNTVNKDQIDPSSGAYANGSVNWNSYPTWMWNGLDEWSVQVVDASDIWGNVGDNEYISDFLFRLAEDGQPTKAAPIQIAYINFFATKEDAEAFADSEATKKVEVEAGTAGLNEGYSIGGKKFFTTSENEPIKMISTTAGSWTSYPTVTTTVSADKIFLGTGTSVGASDNLPIENENPSYNEPVEGETMLGNGSYPSSVGGLIKITDEHTYLRFWGWTGQHTPVAQFGYQINDDEPVFDDNFTVVDEALAALVATWGHPNAVRACITVPLTGLEPGRAHSVQLLVKNTDGTIGTMSSGFHNFTVASEIEYDYVDENGNYYTYDGTRVTGTDGTVMYTAKFDDGNVYATDGYFYALKEYRPGIQQFENTYDALEGVEHTEGTLTLTGWPVSTYEKWMSDALNKWDWALLGGSHMELVIEGSFGADSGVEAVGYQFAGFDEVWSTEGNAENFIDETGKYKITARMTDFFQKGEYEFRVLVKKDGQTYIMPGSRVYKVQRGGKFDATHFEWDAFALRFAEAPAKPEAPIGVNVNPYVFTADDFADGSIDVTIPTGDRQHSWIKITGMKGKVLTINNKQVAKYLIITDKEGNSYDFRKSPSYYGLALPILEDEYMVKVKTVDTTGNDKTYTFVDDPMLLVPEALEGEGTTEAPYELKYSNKYTVMANGEATFTYTATDEGVVGVFASMGTITVTTSAGAVADEDGMYPVSAGDVVTAVLKSADGGYVYSQINFLAEVEHEHVEEITAAGVPATCTETGFTDEITCSVCGITLQRAEVAPIRPHTWEKVEKVEATCTEDGHEEYKKCSVCGVAKDEIVVIPAGHTEEVIPAVDATCTEKGKTEGKKCSVCGEILVAQKDVAAKGHTAGDWETVTEAAVGVEGKKVKKCTVCDAVVEEEAIAALEAPATTAPATDATTEAPAATTAPATTAEAKGGCGSIIGASAAALVLAAAAAAVALKKKED